jgi:hypothetical protein
VRHLLLSAFALLVALAVHAPSPGSAAAPSPLAGTTGGITSQGYPVVVVVSSDGRQVRRASAGLALTCSDGQSAVVQVEFTKLPLSASGRASYRDAATVGTGWDGAPATFSGSMSASITRRTKALTGTWEQTQTVQNPDGTTRVCSSGKVTLKSSGGRDPSRPLGGSYGGFTSKGRPIVVQVAPDGRKVTAISGLFDLRCAPGRFYFVGDNWAQIPVSGGSNRFGVTVRNQTYRFGDGTPYQVSASVSGAVDRAGRTVRGRWRTGWTIPIAGATDTCDSGPLTFSATR